MNSYRSRKAQPGCHPSSLAAPSRRHPPLSPALLQWCFFLGFFAVFVITAERRRCCDVSRAMQQDGPSKTPGRAGRGGATLSHVGIRNTEGFAAAHNTPPPAHAAALFTFNTKSLLIPKKKNRAREWAHTYTEAPCHSLRSPFSTHSARLLSAVSSLLDWRALSPLREVFLVARDSFRLKVSPARK